MKAIIRSNNEVIDLIAYSAPRGIIRDQRDSVSYIDSSGIEHTGVHLNFYWDIIEDPQDYTPLRDPSNDYWTSLKHDAAIHILTGMISQNPVMTVPSEDLVKIAVNLSKELIEELKK